MSAFLNRFQHNDSGQIVTNASFAGTPVYHDALAYDETVADTLAVAANGTAVSFHAGIGFDAAGAMLIVEASGGLPSDTVWQSGMPLSANQLCVDATNSVIYYLNGVGYTSVGAVAVTDAGGAPPIGAFYQQEANNSIYIQETADSYIQE